MAEELYSRVKYSRYGGIGLKIFDSTLKFMLDYAILSAKKALRLAEVYTNQFIL